MIIASPDFFLAFFLAAAFLLAISNPPSTRLEALARPARRYAPQARRIIVCARHTSTTIPTDARQFVVATMNPVRFDLVLALLRFPLLLLWALVVAGTAFPAAGRDRGADGHFSQRTSSHFTLLQDVDIDRYHGRDGRRAFERNVLEVLEDAYRQTGEVLGIRPRRSIQVVVYDGQDFERQFAGLFRFSAAGFFNGTIHIRGTTRVDPRLVRTLHHEYLHAALGAVSPSYRVPGWVNEGLAEWFENLSLGKRHLSHGELAVLSNAALNGRIPSLSTMSAPSFGGLDSERATLAYLYSYAAIEHIARRGGKRALRSFIDQLLRTRNVDRALERSIRADLNELESRLLDELR